MKSQNPVRLSIDVPSELHRTLKLFVVRNHLNIKNYVVDLIKEDLSEELEDYMLGELALKAEKEGGIGAKESEKLLKKLRKSASKTSTSKISHHKKSSKK
jgi:predicted DNA-binding protein